ncbi:hypothetical protein RRF57_006040 [Xylaria bambusicola]|uniref:Uncharacterized protein n=1 Tax=Xylaria bambusicola TaxID=326684 RepID=A0AAN7UDM6_9PEZI
MGPAGFAAVWTTDTLEADRGLILPDLIEEAPLLRPLFVPFTLKFLVSIGGALSSASQLQRKNSPRQEL